MKLNGIENASKTIKSKLCNELLTDLHYIVSTIENFPEQLTQSINELRAYFSKENEN